ncbi:MAG: hypothetical protein QM680_02670 [Luteolibacter sp.]
MIALSFGLVVKWWKNKGYESWIARPACWMIAVTGLVMGVEQRD